MDLLPPVPGEIPRRVFLFCKKDDEMMADCKIMEIMVRMEKELINRDFTVTYNDDDKNDEQEAGLRIIFLTKGLLIDIFTDQEVEHDVERWFTDGMFSIVLVDDKEGKFLDFVTFCCQYESDDEGDPNYLSEYKITPFQVAFSLGFAKGNSNPKHRLLNPGISLSEAENFAVQFAEDVNQIAFKPLGLDYYNLDRGLKLGVVDIFDKIVSQIKATDKDLLFAIFSGCKCHCFDTSIISKLIRLRRPSICGTMFGFKITLTAKDYNQSTNGSFTLRDAFLDHLHYMGKKPKTGEEFLTLHLRCGLDKSKYFITIDDFDISNTHAYDELANLSSLLGRKSLVIVTTYGSNEFLKEKFVISNVPGTPCINNPGVMSRCHTIPLSEFKRIERADTSDENEDSENESLDISGSVVKEKSQFRRKRAKGPNPLSCKKKQPRDQPISTPQQVSIPCIPQSELLELNG